jgi:alpha-beta hydrolase superfamily lysophospholipase
LTTCRKPEYFKAVVLSAPAIVIDPNLEPGAFKVINKPEKKNKDARKFQANSLIFCL